MFFKWLELGKGVVDDLGHEPAYSTDNTIPVVMARLNVDHRVFAVEQFRKLDLFPSSGKGRHLHC
jgi:hypothetical protein